MYFTRKCFWHLKSVIYERPRNGSSAHFLLLVTLKPFTPFHFATSCPGHKVVDKSVSFVRVTILLTGCYNFYYCQGHKVVNRLLLTVFLTGSHGC
jgi:hypothetical protein